MIEIVIPAYNEADTISDFITSIRHELGANARIIVVDNASSDQTSALAVKAGADCVVAEGKKGKGYALVRGSFEVEGRLALYCDADIRGLPWREVDQCFQSASSDTRAITRIAINRPPGSAPVTTLLARPLLLSLGLPKLNEPIGGIFFASPFALIRNHLPGGWGVDIALTHLFLQKDFVMHEHLVKGVTHRARGIGDYEPMAEEVCLAFLRAANLISWDHSNCTLCNRD